MGRKYDLAIFDMDGTLTKVKSSWNHILNQFGLNNDETYQAFVNQEIDEIEFMKRDIALWKQAKPNITRNDVNKMLRTMPLIDGIQETVATLHYNEIKCAICSGGLMGAAEMISKEFNFDYYIADDIATDEFGKLTGEGIANIDLSKKDEAAMKIIKKFKTTPERTITIGNSYGDVPMFNISGLSIAFNPIDMEYTGTAADHVVKSNNISDILSLIIEI